MGEGGEFPSTEMSSEEQDALAALRSAIEVLKAIVDHDLADVFPSVAREKADFGELTAQRGEDPAHNLAAFFDTFFGERKRQIQHADTAQFTVEEIENLPEQDARRTRPGARQHADRFDHTPNQRVFETKTHPGEV